MCTRLSKGLSCMTLLAGLCLSPGAMAAWDQQTIVLNPGWNAVFFEVQPTKNLCADIFKDVPIKSVWAWNQRFSSVQYIRNPNELLPDQPEWLTYFPEDRREAFVTTLYAIHSGHAYLIELAGDSPVTLELHGRLIHRTPTWLSDSFNFAGFHIDPQHPPTFREFFEPSRAHNGQPVYRLNASGEWEKIQSPASTFMRSGEAYWLFSKGQSSYAGPLTVDVDSGRGLNYGLTVTEEMLIIRNYSSVDKVITLSTRPSNRPTFLAVDDETDGSAAKPLAGEVVLAHRTLLTWKPMGETLEIELKANITMGVPLAVMRSLMPDSPSRGALYESILEVSDGAGSRFQIPVTAEKHDPTHMGLWVGTATITAVSEAGNTSTPTTPTPTASSFQFRIIVHVDDATTPQVHLLQEVYMMQVQETLIEDPPNSDIFVVDEPSFYVLLTEDDLVPLFQPIALRDGELVGRRISAPAYVMPEVDDNGDKSRPPLIFTGLMGDNLTVTIDLPFNDPLNPFVHLFHPDHNNLNELYNENLPLPEGIESFTFTRDIELDFMTGNPLGIDAPNWGEDVLGGIYTETIRGAHQKDIYVSGTFLLNHVVDVGILNPEPPIN